VSQTPEELEQEWAARHPNPSGLPDDHPYRVAARTRAQTFKKGDVPDHHAQSEPFPAKPADSSE
jgi:hypothetical protein